MIILKACGVDQKRVAGEGSLSCQRKDPKP